MEAADHMSLPCTGASGAFGSLDEIGKAATLFRDAVASEAELVAQVKAGTVFCVAIGITPGPPERPGERRERRDRGDRERRGGDRDRGGRGGDRDRGGGGRGGGRGRGGSGRGR
jgi:hypothetical protein